MKYDEIYEMYNIFGASFICRQLENLYERLERSEQTKTKICHLYNEMEEELYKIKEALTFYADRTNYGKEKIREDLYLANSANGITFSNIHHDDGEIARKALKQTNKLY